MDDRLREEEEKGLFQEEPKVQTEKRPPGAAELEADRRERVKQAYADSRYRYSNQPNRRKRR